MTKDVIDSFSWRILWCWWFLEPQQKHICGKNHMPFLVLQQTAPEVVEHVLVIRCTWVGWIFGMRLGGSKLRLDYEEPSSWFFPLFCFLVGFHIFFGKKQTKHYVTITFLAHLSWLTHHLWSYRKKTYSENPPPPPVATHRIASTFRKGFQEMIGGWRGSILVAFSRCQKVWGDFWHSLKLNSHFAPAK